MFPIKTHHLAVVVLLLGALAMPPRSTALGQAIQWQPRSASAQANPYYVAQQPGAPAPAQPPVVQPQPEQPSPFEPSDLLESADPLVQLASVPNMFGDSNGLGLGGQVYQDSNFFPGSTPYSDIPSAGAARNVKISENNKALPVDRVYFTYNHFHNALEAGSFNTGPKSFSIDQYTIGAEKTFRDGLWSCEVRMPFTGAYRFDSPDFSDSTGHFGNLAVIVKRLLYSSCTCVVGAGLGINTPTGSDVRGTVGNSSFAIRNDAVHLAPWIGFLSEPREKVFFQGFFQVDVPLGGNGVVVNTTPIGKFNEQTLMFVDLETGYWLFRNRDGVLSALAGVLEFHYTTTLQDADKVQGFDPITFDFLTVTNLNNRVDVFNMTLGVHAQLGELTTLSVGGAFPLDSAPDRMFDGELQIFLNRRF
jgi:hypothetical protein